MKSTQLRGCLRRLGASNWAAGLALGLLIGNSLAADVTIKDVTVVEPAAGTVLATFEVRLSAPVVTGPVRVYYSTSDGTAVAPGDYLAAPTGVFVEFPPGATLRIIAITVNSDTVVENAEDFYVDLLDATGGVQITDRQGLGVILPGNPPPEDLDFGDAPDPTYPVLLANNGARHRINNLFLGAKVEPEPDGLPSPLANGDDTTGADDEDGVVFLTPWVVGGAARVRVTTSLPGVLDVWADFLGDGDWFDPGEHVIIGAGLPAGPSFLAIPIPAWAALGNCYLRFRLSPGGAPFPVGFINGGEVEDYMVELKPPGAPPTSGTVQPRPRLGGLTIAWDKPNALLQTAPALEGPWTTLVDPDSELDVTSEDGQQFFRLVEGRNQSRSGLGRRTLASMTREADLIIDAVVTGITYANSEGDQTNTASWPHTFVTLEVLDTLKGRVASSNLCVRFLGGLDADGERIMEVSHSTRFDVGERSLLFVRRNGHAARPLVGGSSGRLRVVNGMVYSEHGHRLVLTAGGRLAFGLRDDLAEVHEDRVGTNQVGQAHSSPEGEEPRPEPPTGQHVGLAGFKTALALIIRQQHSEQELQNPVLTVSADCTRAFIVPLPRHRPPRTATIESEQTEAEEDEEAALVRANGGNPVLPRNR